MLNFKKGHGMEQDCCGQWFGCGTHTKMLWIQVTVFPLVIAGITTLGKLVTPMWLSLPRCINKYLVGCYERRFWLHPAVCYSHPDPGQNVKST